MTDFNLLDRKSSNNPRLWTLQELVDSREYSYTKLILEENGFRVYFSNKGEELKEDPLWNKRRVKSKNKQQCNIDKLKKGEKCSRLSSFELCQEHRKKFLTTHPVDWIGYFTPPSNILSILDETIHKKIDSEQILLVPMHSWIIERIIQFINNNPEYEKTVDDFMKDIQRNIPGKIPDSTSLQESLMSNKNGDAELDDIMKKAQDTIEKNFPADKFKGINVPICRFSIKNKTKAEKIKNNEEKFVSFEIPNLPVRIAAALIYLGMIAEEANRGDAWFRKQYHLGEPKRAGAHFAYSVYVLRKEGRMSVEQISRVLQIPPWE
ncbi:MAG: hypothetical protein OdinLCB4_002835 [Candidatus Odinarchaeum yellowstonii]|uniref:Uncharacterized protein n=1 Tax=Odinarchaeota yellowstonii (strain LCB_4) TaxID=1841599 RepID=A0AAF0D3M4_ODILC|nr:MAG: hypothetical protein OdinLCB4_002835 [Candidatus Odinarchaeum yellowstonii]